MSLFRKKPEPPQDKLSTWQLVERFKGEIQDAIDAATEGRDNDFKLQHDIALALKTAAQAIDFRRACRQPI